MGSIGWIGMSFIYFLSDTRARQQFAVLMLLSVCVNVFLALFYHPITLADYRF
jgi:hypothetical protein